MTVVEGDLRVGCEYFTNAVRIYTQTSPFNPRNLPSVAGRQQGYASGTRCLR
jgi:hypothetical protein